MTLHAKPFRSISAHFACAYFLFFVLSCRVFLFFFGCKQFMTTSVLFIRVSLLLVSSFLIPMVRTPLCSSCQYDFFICSPSRVLILNMLFSFHLSPRVSAPLLNKVSMGVIGPKFAWTNHTGCCLSMAPALSRFGYVCVCLSVSVTLTPGLFACRLPSVAVLLPSNQSHTHIFTRTQMCLTY